MSETLTAVQALVTRGEVRISDHGCSMIIYLLMTYWQGLRRLPSWKTIQMIQEAGLFWRFNTTPTRNPSM